ncbi:MAG: cell division protein CrgA [Rhodoluna sp.]|jgi:hypothetical protein|nr:cell division protein CrgA [Rhodoluna sp.]
MSENEQKPTNLRKRPAKPEVPDSVKVSKKSDGANPAWFLPVTLSLMIVGLVWIMVYYISQTQYPLASLGAGNIIVGFGLMMVGFGFLTRWK